MITIDNVQYRNLEEQVKKNMDDIQYMLEEEGVLNEFGIKVVGQITTSNQLPDPATYTGEYGDAYAVGTAAPYTLYIYTRANGTHPTDYWFNIGQFPAPSTVPGPTGPQGPKGPQGTRGSTWTNGTSNPTNTSGYIANDKYLNTTDGTVFNFDGSTWQDVGSIRGPQGIQGPQGNVGPQGIQGIQGPKGDTGPAGPAFVIAGKVANEGQLPPPSALADNIAYLVGNDTDGYDLYVQLQDTNTWQNVGKAEGVEGPQGPIGPQGVQGPVGPQGSTGPQGVSVQNVTVSYVGETPEANPTLQEAIFTVRFGWQNSSSDPKYTIIFNVYRILSSTEEFGGMDFHNTNTDEQKIEAAEYISRILKFILESGLDYIFQPVGGYINESTTNKFYQIIGVQNDSIAGSNTLENRLNIKYWDNGLKTLNCVWKNLTFVDISGPSRKNVGEDS